MNGSPEARPLFSVGLVTYNRRAMLKECLKSLTEQTFADFEVIVGNDYPKERLSCEELGLEDDKRMVFINHPQNMGELANLNHLLQLGRGRYFTWLGDDDMYFPHFFEAIHKALVKFEFPLCVFTSFAQGAVFPDSIKNGKVESRVITGRRFLRSYLSREIELQGCFGVFDIDYLRHIGGMRRLGKDGTAFYSDNLLAIQSGLLERVVYIDARLIFFRRHETSQSWMSRDWDNYRKAQANLCRASLEILNHPALRDDLFKNFFLLLSWCRRGFVNVVRRSEPTPRGWLSMTEVFFGRCKKYFLGIWSCCAALGLFLRTAFWRHRS